MKSIKYKLALLLVLSQISCGFHAKYGLLPIQLPNGAILYFRREVRGMNYDALSLSTSSNVCATPDPNTSYIFSSLDHTVFYKFVGPELHLYTMSTVQGPARFPESVVVFNLTNQQFSALENARESNGLQLADVPLDNSVWCLFGR